MRPMDKSVFAGGGCNEGAAFFLPVYQSRAKAGRLAAAFLDVCAGACGIMDDAVFT